MNVKQARVHLEINGFYVHNLWQVEDVKRNFECTDDEAQDVLDAALTNDYITEQIFNSIRDVAEAKGLVEITDE